MIEIIAIIFLSFINYKNAIKRERSGILFIALTLLLWISFEILGIYIELPNSAEYFSYHSSLMIGTKIGLIFGCIGGFFSYLLAKKW